MYKIGFLVLAVLLTTVVVSKAEVKGDDLVYKIELNQQRLIKQLQEINELQDKLSLKPNAKVQTLKEIAAFNNRYGTKESIEKAMIMLDEMKIQARKTQNDDQAKQEQTQKQKSPQS